MRLLLVEPLLQALEELLLEPVDLIDVAEDGAELILGEHVRPLSALLDVALRTTGRQTVTPFPTIQYYIFI